MKNWIVIIMLLLCPLASNAGENISDLNLKRDLMDANLHKNTVSRLTRIPKSSHFSYNVRYNPFFGKIENKKNGQIASNRRDISHRTTIDSLRYSGMLRRESIFWAIISHSDGKITSVKLGEQLKDTKWAVVKINKKFLLLEEKIFVAGNWKSKVFKLYLTPGFPEKELTV